LVRTDKYIRRKNSGGLSTSIQTILAGRGEENSKRRDRIQNTLRRLISEADLFAVGSKVQVSSRDVRSVLTDGLTYLIENVYTKLNYVDSGFNTEDEVTTALTRDSIVKNLQDEYLNASAHTEMLSWLADELRSYRSVTIRGLTDKFLKRPFGWAELDTLGVLAELVNLGKIELRLAQATVNPKESGLVPKLRSKSGVDKYLVRLCDVIDQASLRVARDLAGDLLEGTPPSDPLKLYATYQEALKASCDRLQGWIDRSQSEQLPFGNLMAQHLTLLQNLSAQDGAAAFFGAVRSQREELEDYVEDSQKIQSFFESQLATFLKARADLKNLESELCHLAEPYTIAKIAQVRQILAMPDPTAQVPQLGQLLQPVQALVRERLQAQRDRVAATGARVRDKVEQYAIEVHPEVAAQLDLAQLTQPIDRVNIALEQAQTIDSAIARERDLEQLEQELMAQVDTAAATLLAQQQLAGAEVTVTKPMVTVRLSQVAGKSILESSQDVDEYLERVKLAIVAEIDRGKRVRLE
jgi:hypothetical protein